jgi:hypothetical protein
MKVRRIIFAMTVVFGTSAQADLFCENLNGIMNGSIHPSAGVTDVVSSQGAQCSTTLSMNGQTSSNCHWAYEFRADDATNAFETLSDQVAECLQVTDSQSDQGVSHPDTYDLRIFSSARGEVGVSLKDKGAIQQTLVFLRITPDP